MGSSRQESLPEVLSTRTRRAWSVSEWGQNKASKVVGGMRESRRILKISAIALLLYGVGFLPSASADFILLNRPNRTQIEAPSSDRYLECTQR